MGWRFFLDIAAPELLEGRVSPHANQYSLALVYQQLRTGTLPFDGTNARQLWLQRVTNDPNVETLSAADRPIVAHALAKDTADRFPPAPPSSRRWPTPRLLPRRQAGPARGPPQVLVAEVNAFQRR